MAILLTTSYQQIGTIYLDYGEIRLYGRYYEQSQANNYTNFQLKTTYYTGQNYVSFGNATAWLDGTRKDYGYTTFYKGETTIMEENRTQYHNEDGSSPTRSINASWTASFGGSGSVNVDVVFPQINRYPLITSMPNFSDEDSPTVTYTTNVGFSSSITEVCMKLVETGDPIIQYREVNVPSGSYTFEFTEAERNILRSSTPNSNTVTIYILLRTMVNGIKYFSTITRTLTIVNGNPTFTHSEIETDSNVINVLGTSSASTIIQNASKMKVTIVPTAVKSSTIANVKVTSGLDYTQTKTTSPYEFIIPVTVSSYVAKVTDSRGNTRSTAVAKTLIEYNPVSLISFDFKRENPTSSNIIVNLEANYYQKTFNSTANVPTVKWKLDDGTLTTIPSSNYSIDTTNNKLTITNYTITNALDYRNKGTFTIVVQDLLTSATDKQEVLKGIPTFDYGEHDLQVNGELFVADTNRENAYKIYNSFKYSTTETVVGIWIDDKPIYRRVISFTNNSTNWEVIGTINNMYTIVKLSGVVYDSGNNITAIPSYGNDNVQIYITSSGAVNKRATSYYQNKTGILILEYTKTTD